MCLVFTKKREEKDSDDDGPSVRRIPILGQVLVHELEPPQHRIPMPPDLLADVGLPHSLQTLLRYIPKPAAELPQHLPRGHHEPRHLLLQALLRPRPFLVHAIIPLTENPHARVPRVPLLLLGHRGVGGVPDPGVPDQAGQLLLPRHPLRHHPKCSSRTPSPAPSSSPPAPPLPRTRDNTSYREPSRPCPPRPAPPPRPPRRRRRTGSRCPRPGWPAPPATSSPPPPPQMFLTRGD
ncbi:hypothetical protein MUK42_06431 [Musa troglodytarum]|uniref:Uncharacterized protein n=1 Tax=Musa troglodytarum TaxID=320322 RepID=A0A9E7L803_9LILI|nr:hypothetical protein MUK42_06431 [Musa troglodytarum]